MDVTKYIEKMDLNEDKGIATLSSRSIPSDTIPKEIKVVIDAIFIELMDCKPSWRNAFKSKDEAQAYKKALGVAMFRSGINTVEKAGYGIAFAQTDESPFFPSVGQFISWCKDGYSQALHQKQLEDNTKRILDEKRLLSSQTWEERQAQAKEQIQGLKNILKK